MQVTRLLKHIQEFHKILPIAVRHFHIPGQHGWAVYALFARRFLDRLLSDVAVLSRKAALPDNIFKKRRIFVDSLVVVGQPQEAIANQALFILVESVKL